MENKYKELHDKKIKDLVKYYESRGFTVFTEPKKGDLPKFLQDFQPDLLVKGKDTSIVIEVKTSETLAKSEDLQRLANIVNSHKGWEFELVVTNPKERPFLSDKYHEKTISEIKKDIDEISNYIDTVPVNAIFLLTWGLWEATVRNYLQKYKTENVKLQPSALIKQIFSIGLINRSDYDWLIKISDYRNMFVHGFSDNQDPLSINDVLKLKTLVTDILNDLEHPDQDLT
jgi:hypothetical protein